MNEGKRFEADFKASVPKDVYYLRLHDSTGAFDVEHSQQRFALRSPYDVVLCRDGIMYCFELKTNGGKSMSFSGASPRIKQRQVDELLKAEAAGAVAGLILNFRSTGETFFIHASDFKRFTESTARKSISIYDARKIGYFIPRRKLRVNYRYMLDTVLAHR